MVSMEQAWDKAAFDIAVDVQNLLKLASPVKTGRLRNSVKARVINGEIVVTIVDYAKFLEFGTPPHVIVPSKKKALKWKNSGGKVKFAKKVNHPGSPPRPFIMPALKEKLGKIVMKHLTKHMSD